MTYLSKLRRYSGGESVMSQHATKEMAEEAAAAWNAQYQTDSAYVEEYDAAKSDWPTEAQFREIVHDILADRGITP